MDRFYANHKDFVKSRNWYQTRNEESSSNYSSCDGARTVAEIFDYDSSKYFSFGKIEYNAENNTYVTVREPLNPDSIAFPCGLHAKSFFNDTFSLSYNNENIVINETDLSNEFDRDDVFKMPEDAWKTYWKNLTEGK